MISHSCLCEVILKRETRSFEQNEIVQNEPLPNILQQGNLKLFAVNILSIQITWRYADCVSNIIII